MSQSPSSPRFEPIPAADELRDQFSSAPGEVIERVRGLAHDDPFGCAHVVRALATRAGRRRLDAAAAALATLLDVDGSTAGSFAAWTVARSEAIDASPPNDELQSLAERSMTRLAAELEPSRQQPIERWPQVSRSVRDVVSSVLAAAELPSGPGLARALQRNHGHLGDGLLDSTQFPDRGDRRMPVMTWLAPALLLYLDVEVVDTTMLLLVLAARDAPTRSALQLNGAEHALERELAASGVARRRWLPHHEGRRLVTADTTVAALDGVTFAAPGSRSVLLTTSLGDVEIWSPDVDQPRPIRGAGQDIRGAVMADVRGDASGDVEHPAVITTNRLLIPRLGMRADLADIAVQPEPFSVVAAGWIGVDRTVAVLRTDGVVEVHAPFSAPATTPRHVSPPMVGQGGAPVAMAAAADGDAMVIVVAHDSGIDGWWPDRAVARTIAPDRAAAQTRCLAAGTHGRADVVLAGTTHGADLWSVRTGMRIAALEHSLPIVDCDWADLDGRVVIALTDADGLVQVWDVADLAPITSASRPITGAATARFAAFGGAPCLVTRTMTGSAETHRMALATVVDEVPQYRSDDVAVARGLAIGAGDALQRETEADAIAEVVTSRSVHPPLAIGLFGEWGEGKSFFMERIWKHVSDRSSRAKKDPAGPIATDVRQVRFNAWHYAEADLWASLVSELFEQLARSESDEAQPGSISVLRAELVRQSKLKERLDGARRLQVELDADVAEETPVRIPYDELSESDRLALEAVLGDDVARTAYEAMRSGAAVGSSLKGRVTAAVGALRKRRRVLWTLLLLVAVTIGLVGTAQENGIWGWWAGASVALATTLAVLRSVVDTARDAKRGFDQSMEIAKSFASDRSERLAALVIRRDVVAAEVSQLQSEYERVVAAGQLAGILEQRLKDGSYRSHLGLMSQIHHDFVEMARLLPPPGVSLLGESIADGERPKDLPSIERIVVYIDDLDRCPPGRVVEVLEAIHLLLAVPLFVVVVAVDPRWLLRALNAHYRQLLTEPDAATDDGAELWRSTPIHYLEKIFQVPFTLSPLDRTRYELFVDDLVGAPVGAGATGPSAPAPPVIAPAAPSAAPDDTVPDLEAPALANFTAAAQRRLPTPATAEELDPLLLHDDERAFLKLLGPPLITTPRAAKRLVNSYGLLLALAGRDGRSRIIGPVDHLGSAIRPHRAALLLLATVVGSPDTSPAFFANLHDAPPQLGWDEFLERQLEYGGDMSRLARTLIDVTVDAARSSSVPPLVGHWHEWVIPCGRLSFQTGRVVVRLPLDRPTAERSGEVGGEPVEGALPRVPR